jgi:hypothetical protein
MSRRSERHRVAREHHEEVKKSESSKKIQTLGSEDKEYEGKETVCL